MVNKSSRETGGEWSEVREWSGWYASPVRQKVVPRNALPRRDLKHFCCLADNNVTPEHPSHHDLDGSDGVDETVHAISARGGTFQQAGEVPPWLVSSCVSFSVYILTHNTTAACETAASNWPVLRRAPKKQQTRVFKTSVERLPQV